MSRMFNDPVGRGAPPAAIMRMLALHSREQIEGFIEIAIGLLDLSDGDPDLEDATDAEDEGLTPLAIDVASDGAGCLIADPDLEHDGREPEDHI